MNKHELHVCKTARNFSTLCVLFAIVISVAFSGWLGTDSLRWQVAVATIALALGVPHGALDHLVAISATTPRKMVKFVVDYVLIAIGAFTAIAVFNSAGFFAVLVMSSIHFGIGDTAFIAEINRRNGKATESSRILFALAAGTLPVFIPLAKSDSRDALSYINPTLQDWHGGFGNIILLMAAFAGLVALLQQVVQRNFRNASDLLLLAVLAIVAPPLIAFAVYFGCWHAVRHTARLTLALPASQRHYLNGSPTRAFVAAVVPGLPALFGVIGVAVAFNAFSAIDNENLLWTALVVVWALTVPHMAATTRLDRKALAVPARP
jgi:Brp/Blh family beta-carotene 15,15'-monooxygenase